MSMMHIWFIAYNDWVYEGCFDVNNLSVTRASLIFSLTHSALKKLHCHILYVLVGIMPKMQTTRWLPYPNHDRPWTVNNFWHCIVDNPNGCAATLNHNQTIGRLSRQRLSRQHFYYILTLSVNGAWTTFGLESRKTLGLCGDMNPYWNYRRLF